MASLSRKQYDILRIPGSKIFGKKVIVTGIDEIMRDYAKGLSRVPAMSERRSSMGNGFNNSSEGLLSFYDH
jgi:hypothetical protein